MYPNVKTGFSTGFSLQKGINGRRENSTMLSGDTRGMRKGAESLSPVEYP